MPMPKKKPDHELALEQMRQAAINDGKEPDPRGGFGPAASARAGMERGSVGVGVRTGRHVGAHGAVPRPGGIAKRRK